MSSRRAPLSSNPNAANSPCRAAAVASRQKRPFATLQREEQYGFAPPSKKQMVDVAMRSPPRPPVAEGRVFTRRSTQQTSFERKLEAARKPAQQAMRVEKAADESLEPIRQWQKHYRRLFPKMVFYFESVAEDVHAKCVKQVVSLGAREEKFFSNAVTHVVTTRAIPPELPSSMHVPMDVDSQHVPQTINPMLLERSSESTVTQESHNGKPAKFTFDAPVSRKSTVFAQELEARRHASHSTDVLHRARELRIKIWSLEKLQRMISTMFEETGATHSYNTRGSAAAGTANLSQLLRNERINGPSDRDPTVATKDIITFKGPYIFIRDIDEKQKPIMFREYAKVAHKEDGDWPQFRSVSSGKCPFVPEPEYSRQEEEALRRKRREERERERVIETRTRSAAKDAKDGVLAEVENQRNRDEAKFEKPQMMVKQYDTESSSRGVYSAFGGAPARLLRGEPVASGVQPSNITSAIHSQMISSTAIGPGAKAGTSKEIHGLQRKVLEKNNTPQAAPAMTVDQTGRLAKRRAQEKLGVIDETKRTEERAKAPKKSRRDAKAGYCENCMDKFDDFDEHVLTRKHRRFAEKDENWKELDALLTLLARPLKYEDDYDY